MSSLRVDIRPAHQSDRHRVVDMTRDVWGGTDYVPSAWDGWMTQSQGILLVAEIDGRVVGLQNQYLQNPDSAWIEGIRVDSEFQGRGIARRILRAGIGWARWQRCSRCRLSTWSENSASNRLAESAGFERVTSFDLIQTSSTRTQASGNPEVRLGRPWESETVADIMTNPSLCHARGFAMRGWTAIELTDSYCRSILGTNSVLVAADRTIRGACVVSCRPPFERVWVEALSGDADAVAALGSYVNSQLGVQELRACVALPQDALDGLLHAGFERVSDFKINLYELDLTQELSG